MRDSTVCYIEKDGSYLMLHRVKKEKDMNRDKWIGVGGGIEQGETPLECVIREVYEETGLTLENPIFRGVVNFRDEINGENYDEKMYVYTCQDFSGELRDCDEGVLEWVPIDEVVRLPIWEGDKVFLKLLRDGSPTFEIDLNYKDNVLRSYETRLIKRS